MLTEAPSTRRNPTKLTGIFDAGSIAVCKADDKVALHIYTTDGEILVRMSERNFVASCRGPRDANGNPLRAFQDLDEDARRQADAVILQRKHDSAVQLGMSDEVAAKCTTAWGFFESGAALTQAEAARQAGIAYPTFNVWVRHNRNLEAQQIRNNRRSSGAYRSQ